MPTNRNRQLDVLGIALVAVTVFVGLSLWSYDRTDPPSGLVYPTPTVVQNACGRGGALVAHWLFDSLGYGAYYALLSLAAVAGMLVVRREIDQPALRTGGWVVSLVGFTALAAVLLPNRTPGPVIGAGGYVGAMGQAWLEANFAYAGSLLFALSVLAAGLLLCTDYLFFNLARATTQLSGESFTSLGKRAVTSLRPKTDLEEELSIDDEDEDDEEEEYEYEDDAEWEEEYYDDEDEEFAEEEPSIKVKTPTAKSETTPEADSAGSNSTESNSTAEENTSTLGRVASKLSSALKGGAKPSSDEESTKVEAETKLEPAAPKFVTPKPKPKSERDEIIEQLEAADHNNDQVADYELPDLELLAPAEEVSYEEHEKEVRRKAKVLERTFKNFGFNVRVVEIETGPVIAQYEVQLEAGLRLSKITGLADDLAIALRVPSVRIVAPIPGKNTVGIEVPNEHRQLVRLREVIEETNGKASRMKIPIYLGKDVSGKSMTVDLAALPHLLIAGRTGTGKSVCLNSIIVSMLMSRGPDEVRMLMIDPKMVELSGYRKLPHLMHPVVTDMKKAEAILAWAVDKMEERYTLLARAGVRHVSVYNQLGEEELRDRIQPQSESEWEEVPKQLPFIVIVADEMADLMMTAGKDVEQHIIRLAQKSRAVGIHLILATQKPTVDVITGLIKSNLPARIAFQVASRTDSRVVLDENGADKLLGHGDMLFLSPGTSTLLRGQGTYLADDEITRVVDFVGTDEPQFAGELMQLKTKEEVEATAGSLKNRDELYEAAIEVVVNEGRGSVSLLQRALAIGYGRAARLIDFMAEDGIVGQYNGSQAREVTITMAEWEAMRDGDDSTSSGGETTATQVHTPAAEASSASSVAAAVPSVTMLDESLKQSTGRIQYDSQNEPDDEDAGDVWKPSEQESSAAAPSEAAEEDLDEEWEDEEYEDDELEDEEYEEEYEDEDEFEESENDSQDEEEPDEVDDAQWDEESDEWEEDDTAEEEEYEDEDYEDAGEWEEEPVA